MEYKNLIVEKENGVVTVTINRPEKLNALNGVTVDELYRVFTELGSNPDVRVIVLTGSGEKAFVAGADIGDLADMTAAEAVGKAELGQGLMHLIETLGKPVIAAVNGFALGGGCELAMACTFRYASQNARLGLPEITLGLIPGYGGTQRLSRLVGRGPAMEMVLRGHMIDADRARDIGLVNEVLPADQLLPQVMEVAAGLAEKSQLIMELVMKAVGQGLDVGLQEGCGLEAALFGVAGSSEDAAEGCRAFLEKRKAAFKDR